MSPTSTSEVVTPTDRRHLSGLLSRERRVIARGLGRSYGDAAQLGGGTVIDMTGITGVWLDAATGTVIAGAGTSLGRIIDTVLPSGWFLPVTPGTRYVTVGGAIAADVHGKNHHRHGSFGQYVTSFDLITEDGAAITATPGTDVFAATVGGMGLTGTISRATLRLIPVESSWMRVDTGKGGDLDSVMDMLEAADDRSTYSVAWVDLTRSGRGRGVVSAAEHATHDETRAKHRLTRSKGISVSPPPGMPRVVTQRTVDAFNRLWYAKAPSEETGKLEPLDSFFYPLDRVSSWNRLYGRHGFLQYQFVLPEGREDSLLAIAGALAETSTPLALAVLKRMGPSRGGLLSFPMPGWTLAVDMPLGDPGLAEVLDGCDQIVAGSGGRVYLAKDSRLTAEPAHEMYPQLGRWRQIRSALDPTGRWASNLSQRLGLTG